MFKKMVQEVMCFKEDSKIASFSQFSNIPSLEKIISEIATKEYGLFPNKNWIEKCLQIYAVSSTYKSIVLCGPPCSGKSSTLNVLVDSLTEYGRELSKNQDKVVFKQQSNITNSHKIKRLIENCYFYLEKLIN